MTRPEWFKTPEPEAVAGYGELVRGAMAPEYLRGITLSLPWPPSVNRYWRHVPARRGVKVLISEEGRAYRRLVGQHVQIRTASLRAKRFAEDARLAVHIDAHPPDARRRDVDNLLKAALDALEKAGLYADDSAIDDLRIRRGERREGGEVVVRVAVLPEG